MAERFLYRKKHNQPITAVQFDLEIDSFKYEKWGDSQTCKRGDWLVNNNGDTYSIDKGYFQTYYRKIGPGVYEKIGEIWAEVAKTDGAIPTKEGSTAYIAGDYLVFDRQTGGVGYAVGKVDFEIMYDKVDLAPDLPEDQKKEIQREYLNRIQVKINECKSSAKRFKLAFYIFQPISITAAAAIPVLTLFVNNTTPTLKIVIAILGGISAIAAGCLTGFKFQAEWLKNKDIEEELDSNLVKFNTHVDPYKDAQNAFKCLVEYCELILKRKNGTEATIPPYEIPEKKND